MSALFESARLRYRGFCKSDLDILYDLFNDPEIQLGANDHYVIPRPESFKDMLEQWAGHLLFCVIEEKETGRFVGQGGLRYEGLGEKNRDATVGLALKKEFWGKGCVAICCASLRNVFRLDRLQVYPCSAYHRYGTEVVEWIVQMGIKTLGLHRISLDVFASNPRAVAVYKKWYVDLHSSYSAKMTD